jgi:hypothetical protein
MLVGIRKRGRCFNWIGFSFGVRSGHLCTGLMALVSMTDETGIYIDLEIKKQLIVSLPMILGSDLQHPSSCALM